MKIDFCACLMRVVVKNTQQALAGDCEIEDGTRRGKLVCFVSFFILDSIPILWTWHFWLVFNHLVADSCQISL